MNENCLFAVTYMYIQLHLHHSTTLDKGAGICLIFSHLLSVTQSWHQLQVYDHLHSVKMTTELGKQYQWPMLSGKSLNIIPKYSQNTYLSFRKKVQCKCIFYKFQEIDSMS